MTTRVICLDKSSGVFPGLDIHMNSLVHVHSAKRFGVNMLGGSAVGFIQIKTLI